MFFFREYLHDLLFSPNFLSPQKAKKTMDSGKKRWLKPITLWSGKLWKWALRAFELPGQLERQNRVDTGNDRSGFCSQWGGKDDVLAGSTWGHHGRGMLGFQENMSVLLILSCFICTGEDLKSESPSEDRIFTFFGGGNECAKWPTRIRCMEISREGEYLDTSNWLKQIEEKTSLAPYQYHHFPEHHFLRTFLGEPKSWDLKDFQHSNTHLLQESI